MGRVAAGLEDDAVTPRRASRPGSDAETALGFGLDITAPPGWQDRSVLRFLAPEPPRDPRLVHRGADAPFAANVVITRVAVDVVVVVVVVCAAARAARRAARGHGRGGVVARATRRAGHREHRGARRYRLGPGRRRRCL
jgi:hypothetical protein